jgi:hypothetical protein
VHASGEGIERVGSTRVVVTEATPSQLEGFLQEWNRFPASALVRVEDGRKLDERCGDVEMIVRQDAPSNCQRFAQDLLRAGLVAEAASDPADEVEQLRLDGRLAGQLVGTLDGVCEQLARAQ